MIGAGASRMAMALGSLLAEACVRGDRLSTVRVGSRHDVPLTAPPLVAPRVDWLRSEVRAAELRTIAAAQAKRDRRAARNLAVLARR